MEPESSSESKGINGAPARWQKLWSIFHSALEVKPDQRSEFLIATCGPDAELQREVEELLASHNRESLLDRLPFLTPDSPPGRVEGSNQQAGPQPGEILANRFQIVGILGRGGMARVYEAMDLELGTRVALKALRVEIASDLEASERFNREINLARRVTHPNACRIFDLFHHSESLSFLTMELLEGETLYDRTVKAR